MIVAHPEIRTLLEIGNDYVNELVIENQIFMRNLITDISNQISGEDGKAVLSIDNVPVEWEKYAEIISDYIPPELNRRSLISKICACAEQKALSGSYYMRSMEVLNGIEKYITELCVDYPCNFNFTKLNIGSIIRSVGMQIENDGTILEQLTDYMNLVRNFEQEKLFIILGMRNYFTDDEMETFIETVLSHDFKLLLVEGTAKTKLKLTKRLIIDADLCEF